jgi:hypothetical protein
MRLLAAQVTERGRARGEGDRVEAFLEGGWWEAEVSEVLEEAAGEAGVVIVDVGGQENEVALADVRARLRWLGGDGSSSADWQPTTEAALAGALLTRVLSLAPLHSLSTYLSLPHMLLMCPCAWHTVSSSSC